MTSSHNHFDGEGGSTGLRVLPRRTSGGHADFKHRFRDELKKVYFGTRSRNAQSLIGLMLVCRIFRVSRHLSVDRFPKSFKQGQFVSARSAWGSSLHPEHVGQVLVRSF